MHQATGGWGRGGDIMGWGVGGLRPQIIERDVSASTCPCHRFRSHISIFMFGWLQIDFKRQVLPLLCKATDEGRRCSQGPGSLRCREDPFETIPFASAGGSPRVEFCVILGQQDAEPQLLELRQAAASHHQSHPAQLSYLKPKLSVRHAGIEHVGCTSSPAV